MKTFTIFGGFWGRNQFFLYIYETTFSKQLVLFSILHSKMSRNVCQLRHKVRNGQHLPHESPNFRNYLFPSDFTDNLVNLSTSLGPHQQNSFFLNFFLLFSSLNSRMSRNMCIWRNKLCNAKTGVGPTFTRSNEA